MAARASVAGGGRLLDRIRKWYYNAAGFNKLGLMRDDTLHEDDDVKEALKRLPEDLYNARVFRIKRALDLSLKHQILPKDQWVKYEELDFELIKVDLVHLGICQKSTVSKGMAGSITLPVNADVVLGISGCCNRELVIADLADTKFTFSRSKVEFNIKIFQLEHTGQLEISVEDYSENALNSCPRLKQGKCYFNKDPVEVANTSKEEDTLNPDFGGYL
ncbi:hypothetical protein DUI87_07314 [Hirundo rustica rustica]|uniref:Cytochrome b-c1 complex subunit 7 n=1 Tax=Hirundo rustica rustica TaxID=333673 RepID=A0A3M0KPG8_HIRRU|nr:hypothetical protein DUI87_07314 [Hirundo rustica rustica]